MVKPGGTGRPRLAISARLAPLPPSRSRICALPSALPSPKVYTHLPAFTASVAGLPATLLSIAFVAGFGAGLTATGLVDGLPGLAGALLVKALLVKALRALGAALPRPDADGFD